jgi:hypothetical protein
MSGRANKKHYREQAKREKREAKERKRDLTPSPCYSSCHAECRCL